MGGAEGLRDLLGFPLAGQDRALGLVEDEPADQVQGQILDRVVHRGGVQGHVDAQGGRAADHVSDQVGLVLQQEEVALPELHQDPLHRGLGQGAVAAREEEDGVLPFPVHLDDGVAVGQVGPAEKAAVHAAVDQTLAQELALAADEARVVDLRAGHGEGDGLVEALAAAADGIVRGGQGLPCPGQMVHVIDVVDIQGADVQDSHIRVPPSVRVVRVCFVRA